jgi:triosephosphate isomerase
MMRKPLALTNWKMEMTVARSLTFVRDFESAIGDLARKVDIIVCPPYTALYPMAQALKDSPLTLGGQNLSTAPGGAYTAEISAALLADVGCRWAMLGHWEVRRHFGDTDETVNRKLHAAQRAGLRPILFVGEARREQDRFREALAVQLQRVLEGCDARQIEEMVVVYEPEWTINVEEPASPQHVSGGAHYLRRECDASSCAGPVGSTGRGRPGRWSQRPPGGGFRGDRAADRRSQRVSIDHGFPAETAPRLVLSAAEGPPVRGHGSPLCSKIMIYWASLQQAPFLL